MSNSNISFRIIKDLHGKSRLQIENPEAKKRFAVVELSGDRSLASDLTLAIRGMDIAGIERRTGFEFEYAGNLYKVIRFTARTITLLDLSADEDYDE